MAWAAIGTAVVGGVISYAGAKKQASAAQKAAEAANQPTTTTRDPWGPSSQYRQDIMARAMGLLGGGGGGGMQTANVGGAQDGGSGLTQRQINQRARRADRRARRKGEGGGKDGGGEAKQSMQGTYEDYARRVLGEYYLNEGSNPYLNDMVAAMRRNSESQFGQSDLQAEMAGRMGGGAHQVFDAALARGVNEAELGMRYQNYGDERDRMTQTYGIGTGYDSQLKSIAQQARASAAANATARRGQSLEMQRFNAMLPYQQLGSVTDIINAMSGQYGTTTTQGPQQAPAYTQDPWSSALQGGLAGYQAYNWGQQQGMWGQQPATGMQTPATTNPMQYAYFGRGG